MEVLVDAVVSAMDGAGNARRVVAIAGAPAEDGAVARPHAAPRARSTGSSKLLAMFLGVLLAVGVVGGWLYWKQSFVHGSEMCVHCDAIREVDRRGPFWFRSEPKAGSTHRELCGAHAWQRVGCWEEDGGFSYMLTPRRD